MEGIVLAAQLRVPRERWYRRTRTWMLAAIAIVAVAAVSSRTTGLMLLGVAGLCVLVGVMLAVRSRRTARTEMVGMIDAYLAARAMDQRPDTEDDARKRVELLAVRQRLSR